MAENQPSPSVVGVVVDQAAVGVVPEIVSDQPVKKVIKGIMKNGGSSHQNSPTASGASQPRKSW